MADFRRPPTAQEAVLAELRARILRGDLPAGSPLRQEVLATDLGVSRVPVREALRMLEAEGHVTYAAHRGYRVAELGVRDLEEIYALRGLIEDDLAARSLATLDPGALARLRDAHARLEAAEARATQRPGEEVAGPDAAADPTALAAANRAFHWAILRPTPRAERILTTLWDASDAYRARWFADPANVARGAEDHRAILAAVEAGDAAQVVARLAAHRESTVVALRAALPR